MAQFKLACALTRATFHISSGFEYARVTRFHVIHPDEEWETNSVTRRTLISESESIVKNCQWKTKSCS